MRMSRTRDAAATPTFRICPGENRAVMTASGAAATVPPRARAALLGTCTSAGCKIGCNPSAQRTLYGGTHLDDLFSANVSRPYEVLKRDEAMNSSWGRRGRAGAGGGGRLMPRDASTLSPKKVTIRPDSRTDVTKPCDTRGACAFEARNARPASSNDVRTGRVVFMRVRLSVACTREAAASTERIRTLICTRRQKEEP